MPSVVLHVVDGNVAMCGRCKHWYPFPSNVKGREDERECRHISDGDAVGARLDCIGDMPVLLTRAVFSCALFEAKT